MAAATVALGAAPRAYDDDIIRAFTAATVVWGIVGFLVGVVIALQLAYPVLNLGLEWTTFGRQTPGIR